MILEKQLLLPINLERVTRQFPNNFKFMFGHNSRSHVWQNPNTAYQHKHIIPARSNSHTITVNLIPTQNSKGCTFFFTWLFICVPITGTFVPDCLAVYQQLIDTAQCLLLL